MADIEINDLTPRAQYTATAGETVFTYAFPIRVDSDLKVYKRTAGSTPVDATNILTLNVHYTVTGAGVEAGGTIVLTSEATLGDIVTIIRAMPLARSSLYTINGTISSANLEFDMDNLLLMFQQQRMSDDIRTLMYPTNAVIGSKDRILPILLSLQGWRMNTAGTALEGVIFATEADLNILKSDLASHAVGKGASMIGLQTPSTANLQQWINTIGTMAYQNSNNVSITGGSVTGITPITITDGGTNATTATQARINLGLRIGVDVQAYHIRLDNLSNLSDTGIVATNGTDFYARTLVGTTNQIDIYYGSAIVNPIFSIASNPTIPGTAFIIIPRGTTTQRPSVPEFGMMRSDTTRQKLQVYEDGDWQDVIVTDTGAPRGATYITQIPDAGLTHEQALSLLSTGILKSTIVTGVISTAIDGTDYISSLFKDLTPKLATDLDGNWKSLSNITAIYFGLHSNTLSDGVLTLRGISNGTLNLISTSSGIQETSKIYCQFGELRLHPAPIKETEFYYDDGLGGGAIQTFFVGNNLHLGTNYVGTGTNNFIIHSGVQPSTLPVDCFQMYASGYLALPDDTSPTFKTASGTVIQLNQDVSKASSPIFYLATGSTAVTQVTGDNTTKIATDAFVNASITATSLWIRTIGPPNYLSPLTATDDIGATGARITKGWFTNLEITNAPTVNGTGIVYYSGGTDVAIADGGTNSSTALANGRMIISLTGAIVEGTPTVVGGAIGAVTTLATSGTITVATTNTIANGTWTIKPNADGNATLNLIGVLTNPFTATIVSDQQGALNFTPSNARPVRIKSVSTADGSLNGLVVDQYRNVLIGNGAAAGASAKVSISMCTSTAPSAIVTDSFQLYSADAAAGAGHACPHFLLEDTVLVRMDQDISKAALVLFAKATIDNLVLDANTLSSTSGAINLTPFAGSALVIDAHWSFDGLVMTAITDNNTTITAYAGKNITIESVAFDGGIVTAVSNLGIGTATFGTNAINVMCMFNGTAPTTSPVDSFQMYSSNWGTVAVPTFRLENDSICQINQDLTSTSSPDFVTVYATANIGIGTHTFGTNAYGTLAVVTGVAPATTIASGFQMYSANSPAGAGHACPTFLLEDGTIVQLYEAVGGRLWGESCKVASRTDGTLATAYANGQVMDGVTLVTGYRILLAGQTDGKENGTYTVNGSGAPTRAETAANLANHTFWIEQGTLNGDKGFSCTNDTITYGVTSIVFVLTGSGVYSAGTGLSLVGNQFSLTAPVTIALGGTNSIAALTDGRMMVSVGGAIVHGTPTVSGGAIGAVTTLTTSGNVGIGLAANASTINLDIKGAADTASQASLQLRSGNSNANYSSNQILFGYNNTETYRHALKSRHGSASQVGNAIDLYFWKFGTDAAGDMPTAKCFSLGSTSGLSIWGAADSVNATINLIGKFTGSEFTATIVSDQQGALNFTPSNARPVRIKSVSTADGSLNGLVVDQYRNVLIGNGAAAGASAKVSISMCTSTAPSAIVTDSFQLYSADAAAGAGHACPHFLLEDTVLVRMDQDISKAALVLFAKATIDNLVLDANTLSSTSGAINLTPFAGSALVIDAHWSFDGLVMTAITDNNTTITAYAGKNITIESVAFDGGIVTAVSNLGIGTSTFGTNAANVICLYDGATYPTTLPAGSVQMLGDAYPGAGHVCLNIYNEDGVVVRLNQDVSTTSSPSFVNLTASEYLSVGTYQLFTVTAFTPPALSNQFLLYATGANAHPEFKLEDGVLIGIYQQAHIANATDAADVITRVNAILVVLENIGFLATS